MKEPHQKYTPQSESEKFALNKINNCIFVGDYQERRFVEAIQDYRDVVVISDLESELKNNMERVRYNLCKLNLSSNRWIGISDESDHCSKLWVKLDNTAFGHYWFQIKGIKLNEREVLVRLKCIRPYMLDRETKLLKSETLDADKSEEANMKVKWKEFCTEWKQFVTVGLLSLLTVHNFVELVRFLCVLVITLFTALYKSLHYIGDYSIRLMREITVLIHVMTPIFLAIIEFFSKCVGGFYILLAMIWRGAKQPSPTNVQGPHFKPLPWNKQAYPNKPAWNPGYVPPRPKREPFDQPRWPGPRMSYDGQVYSRRRYDAK